MTPIIFNDNVLKQRANALVATISFALACVGFAAPAKYRVKKAPLVSTLEGSGLHTTWANEKYKFTDKTYAAYLRFSKANALAELDKKEIRLPGDFLDWVDSDPIVQASVYGSPQPAHEILCVLRSLDLDLGKETVRKNYTQLALTMAITNHQVAPTVDLKDREPINLVIPANPLAPVDTNDPQRELDANDHIINFLNSVPVVTKRKVQPTKWVEIPNVTDPSKPTRKQIPDLSQPAKEVETSRPRYACEVIGNKELTARFNAYMKAKGQTLVMLDCRSPQTKSRAQGADRARILEYTNMFRQAYIAKGLLLARRDPKPSLAESCAFLIRNNEYKFPAEVKRAWPLFPLNAPWPVTTFLGLKRHPLREADDLWNQFKSRGKIHSGCAYIGAVAQDGWLTQARSMAPFNFGYGSVQMGLKDGGVCGTISGISSDNRNVLGIPSSTAAQPGHCAYVYYTYNPANNTYGCRGGNYVTGGDSKTNPHLAWIFNGGRGARQMFDHQNVTAMVNSGFEAFLRSNAAYKFYRELPPEDIDAHGAVLAASGLAICPANTALAEIAFAHANTPEKLFTLKRALDSTIEATKEKPGAHPWLVHHRSGLTFMAKLAALPATKDRALAQEIYSYLKDDSGRKGSLVTPAALLRYKTAVEGLARMLSQAEVELKAHLVSTRTAATCNLMVVKVKAAIAQIEDPKQKFEVASRWHKMFAGKEAYLGGNNVITADPSLVALVPHAKAKLPDNIPFTQSLLDNLSAQLGTDVGRKSRDPKVANLLIAQIRAVIPQIKDHDQKISWTEEVLALMGDAKEYQPHKLGMEKINWKLVEVSLESNTGKKHHHRGYGVFAFDGNPGTIWHTYPGGTGDAVLPQEISFDMGEVKKIIGFTYTPRKHLDGMVDDCAFYTSTDGKAWNLAVEKKFEGLTATSETQNVECAPTQTRYVKFVAKHVMAASYLAVAELGVIEDL